MAGSEGSVGGQTELLTGWSCVVHRPSEDPEPSSLPSTVDIAAFSSGPSVEPAHSPENDCINSDSDSGSDSENSVSDASGSCSYSSSDTDSSSSSQGSSASSINPPHFSVTSSQTDGLRLTIATVRKSCSTPPPKDETSQSTDKGKPGLADKPTDTITTSSKSTKVSDTTESSINSVIKHLASPKLSSSDSDTDCTESDTSTNSESRCTVKSNTSERKVAPKSRDSPSSRVKCLRKFSAKTSSHKASESSKTDSAKRTVRQRETATRVSPRCPPRGRGRPPLRGNKMASLPLARMSSPHASSSDGEDSDSDTNSAMLHEASYSLQEIRQEDLAAILPDQQDCDAFGGFECEARTEKPDPDVGDGSGSDMELPTQLVNAAIQRVTESSSETESQPAIYASTLLQQFVQQTQLLNNTPLTGTGGSGSSALCSTDNVDRQSSTNANSQADSQTANDSAKSETVKRKRGRPRKNLSKKSCDSTVLVGADNTQSVCNSNLLNGEYCGEPNVSPDSGIQNSPDHLSSPEPSPSPNVKTRSDQQDCGKSRSSINGKLKSKVHRSHTENGSKLNGNKTSSKSNKNEVFKSKVVQKQKISVTCNNLDRVLYANADRVLYPPRRKVGRPATKSGVRKPGRPPKHRHPLTSSDTVNSNSTERINEDLETENVTPMNRYKHNSNNTEKLATSAKVAGKQTECSKKVQNANGRNATKGVHKIDTKKNKKIHRSLSDNDIVQLTSNTLSLSLGKSSDLNVSDISDTNVNSVPKKIKSSGALLSEICERVSKRLEFNTKYIQAVSTKPVLQSTASDENTSKSMTAIPSAKNHHHHHHKVLHVIKHPKSMAYIKNKAKLNALKSKLTTFKHMKVMHTKHKHKKHKKHKIKILKSISTQSSIPKVDTDIDKLILDFVKCCNLGTNKSQKENLPEMFRCVKKLSKKRKGIENNEGRKKKKQCNTNNGENKETNSNEQRLPLKKRHYHISGNNEHKNSTSSTHNTNAPIEIANTCKDDTVSATAASKPATDVKNTAKNGVVNINKGASVVSTKCVSDKVKSALTSSSSHKEQNATVDVKIDSQPYKSPTQHAVNNKSVLVMNKAQQHAVSKSSTTNNNNVYNMRKMLDSEDLVGVHIDEAIEACITKYTAPQIKHTQNHTTKQTINETSEKITEIKKPVSNSMTATTPKKRHRLETENITNCTNQQIEKVTKKLDGVLNSTKTSENSTDTIIAADNKNSTLENVVSELKNKKNLTIPQPAEPVVLNKKYNDKKVETVAQMITRKKNRLEDLASNLVSKINTSAATEALDSLLSSNQKKSGGKKVEDAPINEISTRASVIKSPVARKAKPADGDKLLDSIVDDKPTGIFLQTVDLELHIPATTIQTVPNSPKIEVQKTIPSPDKPVDCNQHNLRNKKHIEPTNSEIVTRSASPTKNIHATSVNKSKKSKLMKEAVVQVEKLKQADLPTENVTSTEVVPDNNKITIVSKKKIRRRKAINRTGFPTLKKKKKKILTVNKCLKTETKELQGNESESNIYDRVPRIGEEASTFMKRTQNCTLSVVSLEKLQAKPESIISSNDSDIVSKWEVSSECDSLPLDECTFTSELESVKSVKSERPLSRLDIKQERMSLRLREVSPATSVETRSSDRTKKKTRDLTPDVKPGVNRDDTGDNSKNEERIRHRTRDSSAGSVQTLNDGSEYDKKMKRKRDTSGEDKSEKKKKTYEDINFKKRLRDLSPASSIEPLPSDKKQRSESVASSSGDDTKRLKKVPRWRKKFLVAGLFSDYYKEDDESVRARRESASNKTRLIYNSTEHPYGLLPPPYHCGKYLRCRKVPFQLPHDLWWQHTHSQLPGRDLVPSWNYRKIRTNVYCVRAPSGACEPQACNCSISSGCEDDCINRLVLAECPSTHRCRNQRIQRHEWAPGLEKFMTDNKGWGVRTKMSIRAGEFILEYVGEVVSDQEFKQRMASRYAHDTHHYCLHLDGGLVIDGHRMGGDGRFVNHSCQPNCEMQKWSVNGQFRMALFALRDISPGEELTYDYNFSLFNPAEGQECKCGSDHCRGVIGGKSQRVRQTTTSSSSHSSSETNNNQVGRVGRPRKNQARRATSGPKELPTGNTQPPPGPVTVTPQVKPMSHQQKCFALQHHCFLLRNLDKVKRLRERTVTSVSRAQSQINTVENNSMFLSQLNALRQPRNMRTRRLAQAQENPELNKAARLAAVLKDLLKIVISAKDENKEQLCSPFINLPSKRKLPEYYQRITDPIDLTIIEQNIATGIYRTIEAFDSDMNKLFANSVRFFGRTSELGIAATRLRKVYGQGKLDCLSQLEDVLGEKAPTTFIGQKDPGDEEEDVIRCICGLYRDEGLMIQCERCLVWQHCECVRADPAAASYHCERCVPRVVDLEIPLEEFTEQGHRYYVSLIRADLQLRQGDTVYVLRDIPIPGTDKKHTYDTVGEVKYTDLDIFRIERLWKDSKTGQRFAFGHHYLRPHETYHEPTRKFFPNEVMRVPLYEVVPIELIMSLCWVLDLNTYCKGRPLDATEEHVYICEYRVDKTARLFSKISKSKYPVCTKSYAFDRFDVRLKISRTYTPHELDNVQVKPRGRRPHETDDQHSSTSKELVPTPVPESVPIIRSREEQRAHLNGILLRLLGRLPAKQTLDVSYLLEGGRRRKKQQS
ncbi:absent small or homeotic discs 1 [Carabus blaptoides fortunei]